MAKPRVFISSTFYDQQHLRHELAAFVQGMGYEPVLSERGQIVYGPEKSPMESCFEEAGRCDILVSIIGGKLGSFSSEEPYTVAQQELKKAIQSHRPVYIFIYKAVFIEYQTYLVNKDGPEEDDKGSSGKIQPADVIKYAHAEHPQIYKFIGELYELDRNNAIFEFSTSDDIIDVLKEQWAGRFKQFLDDEVRRPELDAVEELSMTTASIKQFLDFIKTELPNADLDNALRVSHPLFAWLRKALGVDYRVFFITKQEMDVWLKAQGFKRWVDPFADEDIPYHEYEGFKGPRLQVSTNLFDDQGRLKLMAPDEWMVSMAKLAYPETDS